MKQACNIIKETSRFSFSASRGHRCIHVPDSLYSNLASRFKLSVRSLLCSGILLPRLRQAFQATSAAKSAEPTDEFSNCLHDELCAQIRLNLASAEHQSISAQLPNAHHVTPKSKQQGGLLQQHTQTPTASYSAVAFRMVPRGHTSDVYKKALGFQKIVETSSGPRRLGWSCTFTSRLASPNLQWHGQLATQGTYVFLIRCPSLCMYTHMWYPPHVPFSGHNPQKVKI